MQKAQKPTLMSEDSKNSSNLLTEYTASLLYTCLYQCVAN